MKALIATGFRYYANFARKQMKVVAKLHKVYKTIEKKTYNDFKILAGGKIHWKTYSRNWRKTSVMCSTYMQQVAKGSLCGICDTKEYARFSSDMYTDEKTQKKSKIVYVSKSDAQAFSMKCGPHLEQTAKYIETLYRTDSIMKYKVPAFSERVQKKVPKSEWYPTEAKKTHIPAMKKCAENKELCGSEAIAYFMIGPITKFEMKWYPVISEMQKITASLMTRNWKVWRNLYPMVQRRRILLAKLRLFMKKIGIRSRILKIMLLSNIGKMTRRPQNTSLRKTQKRLRV